jgi:hypothetical protein
MSNIPLPHPNPTCPIVTRVISNSLLPDSDGHDRPITWVLGAPHPLVPDATVVRMFVDRGGVEIYSKPNDNKAGMRNLIPMSWVRIVEEAMPIHIFVEELAAAETDDDDDDGDGEGEGEGEGAPSDAPHDVPSTASLPANNGQPAS